MSNFFSSGAVLLYGNGQRLSEVRLIRVWDRAVLAEMVFMDVLGADQVRPFTDRGPVGDGRAPGSGEDVRILDRERKL